MSKLPGGSRARVLAAASGVAAIAAFVAVAATAVLVGGCGTNTATPSASATAPASSTPSASAGPVFVRWFVGLGSGTQPTMIDPQKDFVVSFNKSHQDIKIKLEIVPNANAYDILKQEIAAGDAPDIIGPVGEGGRHDFDDQWLDLTGEIERQQYDLTQFEPGLVNYYDLPGLGQIGLPYLIYPGYIWYNKDLFAKAGLPNLPTKVGEPYLGRVWDWANLHDVAARLTVDTEGRKSTDVGFDAGKIARYGMDFQWCDGRRIASLFGGGSFVGTDGKTAQIPAVWRAAFSWYYDAIWGSHIVPTGAAEASTLLAQGNSQSSGNVAMNAAWTWSIGSIWDSKAGTAKMKSWDMGVIPSLNGATSSPLDADTFMIHKATKHPAEAFQAMVAIMAEPSLMKFYGGMPAKKSAQFSYTSAMDAILAEVFPGNKVTWSVLGEMSKYPAVPSHESGMPNLSASSAAYGAFLTKLQSKPGLDLEAELKALRAILQADFDAAAPK